MTDTQEIGKRKHSILAYVTTVLAVLSLVKCSVDSQPNTTHGRVEIVNDALPFAIIIDSCKYIATPQYSNAAWHIRQTTHAGDCPNEIHKRKVCP